MTGDATTINRELERGIAALRAGRPADAEGVFREVLERAPDHPDALHLLGVSRRHQGQPDEAVELIRRAIARRPGNPSYHGNLGTALEAAGRTEEAMAAYREALRIAPDHRDSLIKLGTALEAKGDLKGAGELLVKAVRFDPDNGPLILRLGKILQRLRRGAQALGALTRAVQLMPENGEAHYELARLLQAGKRYDDALKHFEAAIERAGPWRDNALFGLGLAHLEAGNPQGMLEAGERWLAREPANMRLLSAKIVALTELGRDKEARKLLDFERFIRAVRLTAPREYADLAAFNAAIAAEVTSHPTLAFEKEGHATRHGGHTGDLLKGEPGPAIRAFEAQVRAAVADYIATLPEDAGHPFPSSRPNDWTLTCWAVVMQTQGHQLPHIHPAAWLSGVYYPELPPALKRAEAEAGDHEGWLEFGRAQDTYPTRREPPVRYYRPEEGLMFLFPSYFYHATVPIRGSERRISIAFDVMAKA